MGRKSKAEPPRNERKPKDGGKKFKKKPCMFCQDHIDWVDYKDVNMLRRYMSDRSKIKARRVNGNCVQHQSDVAMAIKTARELALLPFATKVTSSRGGGRGGGGGRGREDRGPGRDDRPARPGPGDAPPPVGARTGPSTGSDGISSDGAGDAGGGDGAGSASTDAREQ
jgi:small subunit ribosomal protein S18